MLSNFLPNLSFLGKLKRSLTAKIFVLGLIVLFLLIPYFMTVGVRQTRMNRADQAEREVSSKWGGIQLVTAPVLQIPVQKTAKVRGKAEHTTTRTTLCILPDKAAAESSIVPEIRYRGIYQVLLYKAQIHLKGTFTLPGVELDDNWKYSTDGKGDILIRVSDLKGIEKLKIQIDGKEIEPRPGAIISVPVRWEPGIGGTLNFSAELNLNGCRSLFFSPIGRNFELSISSPWAHPSFTGSFLPGERKVDEKGFSAKWNINELNSSCPQKWYGELRSNLPDDNQYSYSPGGNLRQVEKPGIGVSLVQPASPYQQVERVTNYAFLVIAIVLVAFLIGENVTKIWIHPLQYFFAGLSLVMFYMLLLALAEHIPFLWSYLVTTLIISGMTTAYCRMIFSKKKAAALLLGGIMLLAYLLVFVLIRLEDYALLAGSFILLILLGVLMRVTGHINREEDKNTP